MKVLVDLHSAGVEKTGKTGSSLLGNFVIWREKIKKYIRETIPHWREILPSLQGNKFFFQAWTFRGRSKNFQGGGHTHSLWRKQQHLGAHTRVRHPVPTKIQVRGAPYFCQNKWVLAGSPPSSNPSLPCLHYTVWLFISIYQAACTRNKTGKTKWERYLYHFKSTNVLI